MNIPPSSVQDIDHGLLGGAEGHLHPSCAIYLLLMPAFSRDIFEIHRFSSTSRCSHSYGVKWHLNKSPRCIECLSEIEKRVEGTEGGGEGGREGGGEGGRREGRREGRRRDGGTEGGRDGGRERGRDGGREGASERGGK